MELPRFFRLGRGDMARPPKMSDEVRQALEDVVEEGRAMASMGPGYQILEGRIRAREQELVSALRGAQDFAEVQRIQSALREIEGILAIVPAAEMAKNKALEAMKE